MKFFDYTKLSFSALVKKIGSSRYFDLPAMLEEVLNKLSGRVDALENAPAPSGDFIPLTGTEVGSPVTGDIEIYSSPEAEVVGRLGLVDGDTQVGLISRLSDAYLSPYSMLLNDGTYVSLINNSPEGFGISSLNPIYKGFYGSQYYGANYDDNTYVQKKYVDDNFARVGTVAPISAIDTGVVGEIRVTPTFIYTCVATDTWVRASVLAW